MFSSNDILKLSKLGEGSYGSVYKAKVISTGKIIAVKVIELVDENDGINSTTLRQLSILKAMNHNNIIKLLGFILETTSLNPRIELLFDFIDQDLAKMMKNRTVIDPIANKHIMRQILTGVAYMHSKNIFHRDLKPQNILISNQQEIKIADFGLGRIIGNKLETMSKEIETLWYRAPQLLFGNVNYDLSVDTWSIGCIFFELSEGKILFQTESEIGQIMEIMRQEGTPKEDDWSEVKHLPFFRPSFPKFQKITRTYKNLDRNGIELLESMISLNPKKRISIQDALKHSYFN